MAKDSIKPPEQRDPPELTEEIIKRILDIILNSESILIPAIVPMEVAHRLFNINDKKSKINIERVEDILISIIGMENCHMLEIDSELVLESIGLLKDLRSQGIGGRDVLILSSMNRVKSEVILTHDKSILKLKNLNRIGPVFNPPLELKIGEEFDLKKFKSSLNLLKSK